MIERNEFNENLDKNKGKYRGNQYDIKFANPIGLKTYHNNVLYFAFVHSKDAKIDNENKKYVPCLTII